MQCQNKPKCKRKVTKAYPCNKCGKKFCSNSCMIDHYFDTHQTTEGKNIIETNNYSDSIKGKSTSTSESHTNFNLSPLANKIIPNKRNSISSIFIKNGTYLKDLKIDPYFDFKNFEKVKIGKKHNILGAGAFGEVYLVKNKIDGKFFAVKQMDKLKILDTGAKFDVVRREIDIHMRLVHPNIIRLYDYHEDQSSFYLILDYANSGTLFQAIKKSKGMDEKRAFKYFIQTTAAVHFIHENNLIHRDLKPENLLIDDKDTIKLCDFGWCIEQEIGNRTTFCGTIEYMAPEIVKEIPYDRSIDVWSLGILLYELLHGYSPFRADTADAEEDYSQVFKNIIKNKFKIDREDLSENCKDLIKKLLSPQGNRFKTKDIFTHPWVTQFESEYISISLDNNNSHFNISSKSDQSDSLFDKVLTQVKERNKDKKKKNKLLTDDGYNFDVDKLLEDKTKQNKIIVKVERGQNEDYENLNKHKKNKFKMLKEIQEIENSIDKHLNDQNLINTNLQKEFESNKINLFPSPRYRVSEDDLRSTLNSNNDDAKKNSVRNSDVKILNQNLMNFHPKSYSSNPDRETGRKGNTDKNIIKDLKKEEKPEITKKERENNVLINYNELLYSSYPDNQRDTNKTNKSNKDSIYKKGINNKNDNQNNKDITHELDSSFFQKELLNKNQNETNSENGRKNILSAIQMLEKAQENKKEIDKEIKEEKTFWERVSNFLNPFKCGHN